MASPTVIRDLEGELAINAPMIVLTHQTGCTTASLRCARQDSRLFDTHWRALTKTEPLVVGRPSLERSIAVEQRVL
jgi:hypothetical protein